MWNNELAGALDQLDAALNKLVTTYQREVEQDLARLQFALDMHKSITSDTDTNDRVE